MERVLKVLRDTQEARRFKRLEEDDSRTAISDADSLAAELKSVIDGEVRFDTGTRALYATDSSNYRQVPIGVVIPRHIEDVENTIRLSRKYGAPSSPAAVARAWPANAATSQSSSIFRNTCGR